MSIEGVVEGLLEFAFYYPLFMTYVWMIGAVYYFYYRENSDHRRYDNPPELKKTPPVTYLVPCHNEGDNARETVQALLEQDYPEFEIIAINDCSGDSTGEILDEIAAADSAASSSSASSSGGAAHTTQRDNGIDGTAKIWDGSSGALIATINGNTRSIRHASVSSQRIGPGDTSRLPNDRRRRRRTVEAFHARAAVQ